MNTRYAPATTIAPPPAAVRAPALLLALWTSTMRTALAAWSTHATRVRGEEAFDRLDERVLRDIGADRMLTGRHVQGERDQMQWRIDSQFRG